MSNIIIFKIQICLLDLSNKNNNNCIIKINNLNQVSNSKPTINSIIMQIISNRLLLIKTILTSWNLKSNKKEICHQ
jgi:hypothetical protein